MRIFPIISIAISAMLFSCTPASSQEWPAKFNVSHKSDITSYTYRSHGSMMGSEEEYSICLDGDFIVVSAERGSKKLSGYSSSSRKYRDHALFNYICAVLDNAGIDEWPDTFLPPFEVMDGTDWSLSIGRKGSGLSFRGSNAGPDNDPTDMINRLIAKYSGLDKNVNFQLLSFYYRETKSPRGGCKTYSVHLDTDGWPIFSVKDGFDPNVVLYEKKYDTRRDFFRISDMLKEDDVRHFKASYDKPNVLDGTMWQCEIDFEDDTIYSSGSNAWPKDARHLKDILEIIKEQSGFNEQ